MRLHYGKTDGAISMHLGTSDGNQFTTDIIQIVDKNGIIFFETRNTVYWAQMKYPAGSGNCTCKRTNHNHVGHLLRKLRQNAI